MNYVKKKLRDEIMCDIALKYRENQKNTNKYEKVNLFSIWKNYDMKYSDFIDVILSLQMNGYLQYERSDNSSDKFLINGEYVQQEFVTLEPIGKSFPETLADEKAKEIKTNLKFPILLCVISAIVALLLSSASLGLLQQIAKWFLSLFHS